MCLMSLWLFSPAQTPSAALEAIVLTRAGDTFTNTLHLPVSGLTGSQVRVDDPLLVAGRSQTIDALTVGGTYDIYYIHSTDGSTWASTVFSGTQFTVVNSPTGEPSGQPSGEPSGQPSSDPTSPSGQPSGQPTGIPSSEVNTPGPTPAPTSEPSGQPSGAPSSTFTPTRTIQYTTVTGNITVDRGAEDFCQDTSMKLHLSFDKKVLQDQSVYIDMPGFTNGPCTSPKNGFDFDVDAYSNSSNLRMTWLEGNYTNMFKDSRLRIVFEDHELDNIQTHGHDGFVEIDIDRANGLKFSCMNSVNFSVQIRGLESSDYFTAVGNVQFTSFLQTTCFLYSSALSLFPAQPQTLLALNLTLRLAMDLKEGDNITLTLPGEA